MGLADAVLLNYSLPLFMPMIAFLLLRERFPARFWPGLVLGFLGIALVLVLATLAQLFLTRAYAQAPAAQVGPFIYACVPFAAFLDGVVLEEWPDRLSLLGAALVVAAGVFTFRVAVRPQPAL